MTVADYVVASRCRCCGRQAPTWTPKAIVEAIRAWRATYGAEPGFNDWRRATPEHPSTKTVTEVFGTWNRAVEAAGLVPRPRGAGSAYWTPERIVDAMLDWVTVNGSWPTTSSWLHATPEHPCTRTVYAVFGTWAAALKDAGCEVSCAVCGDTLPDGRAGRLYCSRKCRQKANRRARDGQPIRDDEAPTVLPVCAGCGGDLDSRTIGCSQCGGRARKRAKKLAAAGLSAGSIERPANALSLMAAATPVSTSDGEADAPAVEEVKAA